MVDSGHALCLRGAFMTTPRAAALCAALLSGFAALSLFSTLAESPTFDEPVQTVAGWTHLHLGDFRMNVEDPPLWEEWAALPNGRESLHPDLSGAPWRGLLDTPALEARFAAGTLWAPGVDGATIVNRSRLMMLFLAVALGALIAFWAGILAGPRAAVIATALFALDPNFLAHAALVKNDVATALLFVAAAFLTWRLGRHFRPGSALALAVVCGIGLGVKFSCLLLIPLSALLLGLRILSAEPWSGSGDGGVSRVRRARAALSVLVLMACVSLLALWGAYGFRFAVTPDPSVAFPTGWVLDHLRNAQSKARGMSPAEWRPGGAARVFLWALAHRLLPEAWLNGFLYTSATAAFRRSFLLGALSSTGFWYYFPFAILVKTPLAELAAWGVSAAAGAWFLTRGRRSFPSLWAAACVLLPPVVYLVAAMAARMNIGIRHVLPVMAFAAVAAGVVLARLWDRRPRIGPWLTGLLLLATALETAAAAPHFLPFFNVAAGGARGGLRLLGDSNLDWGQAVPELAEWQRAHPGRELYLSYFGVADPAFYGIRYHPLPGNYLFGPPPESGPLRAPSVVALSASVMQGLSVGPALGDRYASFRQQAPIAVLGGALYLFDVPDEATAATFSRLVFQ
jgi:hypothetical protein